MGTFPKLYPEDLEAFDRLLKGLADSCGAQGALFLHRDGRVIASRGWLDSHERDEIASKVVGFWTDLLTLTGSLGGDEPSYLYLPMGRQQGWIRKVNSETLVVMVFDGNASTESVLSAGVAEQLNGILRMLAERNEEGRRISKEFGSKGDGPFWPGTPLPA